MLDACRLSKTPVIASHTALRTARGGTDDKFAPRGITEECAVAVAATGGVLGPVLCPEFLSTKPGQMPGASLAAGARHIAAWIALVNRECSAKLGPNCGEGAIALGTDFDGWIPSIPQEKEDISYMPLLTYFLLEAGVSEEAVKGMYGENFLRVWSQAA